MIEVIGRPKRLIEDPPSVYPYAVTWPREGASPGQKSPSFPPAPLSTRYSPPPPPYPRLP
jgi:hypothetical protein